MAYSLSVSNPSFLMKFVKPGLAPVFLDIYGKRLNKVLTGKGNGLVSWRLALAALNRAAGDKDRSLNLLLQAIAFAGRGQTGYLNKSFIRPSLPEEKDDLLLVANTAFKVLEAKRLGDSYFPGEIITSVIFRLWALPQGKAEAEALWERLMDRPLFKRASGKLFLARKLLSNGPDQWCLKIAAPLFEKGLFSPSEAAGVFKNLERIHADKKLLAKGLRRYISYAPRKDLALLTKRVFPPGEAKRAIQAALREAPNDVDLIKALSSK